MIRFRSALFLVLFAASMLFVPVLSATAPAPLDINQATVEQLEQLNGIGAAKARAIVEFRAANGPFDSVDDLRQVRGIGDKLMASLRPHVTVGAPDGSAPDHR